jgi:transcriptional regulator with XRE-family HTH domain
MTNNNIPRKYAIMDILDAMPTSTALRIKADLPHYCGVTRQTFATWLNARVGDKLEISADKLQIVATVLSVNINTMFNYVVKPHPLPPNRRKYNFSQSNNTNLIK